MSTKRWQHLSCSDCEFKEEYGCRFSGTEPQPQIIIGALNGDIEFAGCPVEYRISTYKILHKLQVIEESALNFELVDFAIVRVLFAYKQDRAVQEEQRMKELLATK